MQVCTIVVSPPRFTGLKEFYNYSFVFHTDLSKMKMLDSLLNPFLTYYKPDIYKSAITVSF